MQLDFDANQYDPTQGGGICFPLADYKVEITAAEAKSVKDNPNAGFLELTLTVVEGEYRGTAQKDRLNIFHTSEAAKQIAKRSLAAYCFAINRPFVQDTEHLIGGRCIVTIGPQADDSKYSEVKLIKCMDGSMPTRSQSPHGTQVLAPVAVPNGSGGPPVTVPSGVTSPAAPSWANQQSVANPPSPPPFAGGGVPPWARQS